jgi:hypothetical protein
MPSKLQICCEALMEACWLAAAVIFPLFFNISSVRMFEPDKMFVFKFLVVISGAACLLKWIDGRMTKSDLSGKIPSGKALLASPLVIPVLALVVSCTLSSVFSIVPAESWWGSYRRAQGAVALYCYVVLFSVVIRELRTPVQLRRLQYAFILTSLPVAGYTILQFLGPDFIPWTDVFYERSSASMGNPIFLGAYLVMVIPLTFSQLLDGFKSLRKNGDKRSGIVLSCCCGTALILQITALLCTQSRGPVLGLAVAGYICFFILLILNRTPGSRRPIFPVVAVGLGSVAAVMVVMIALMTSDLSVNTAAVCLGATVILVGAVYLFLWHTTFGRNWLWLAWLAQAAALALIFAAGPAHKIAAGAGLLPAFGRFVQFSDNSVLARRSIWQTGLDIMRSGAPATLPNGAEDGFHILRPAVGYGPECIWFPVNLHAVTGLVEIHSGNADRMHNEMYDQLISAGFVGAILYLFVFSAAMFYSLRYLGLVDGVRQRILFAVFIGGGSVAGVLLPWLYGMTEMAGVGIQAGLLAGMLGYVAWRGFCRTAANHVVPSSGHVLVLGVLGALIAHFGENAVGISVGTTRAYYFLLLAVLSVLVAGNIPMRKKFLPSRCLGFRVRCLRSRR